MLYKNKTLKQLCDINYVAAIQSVSWLINIKNDKQND